MSAVRPRTAAPIAIAAAALALSACGGSGNTSATLPAGTGSSGDGSSSSSPSSASSSSKSTSVDPTAPITLGDPKAAITAPGTALRVGQPATLVAESGKKGDKYYTKAIYKVTVTDTVGNVDADAVAVAHQADRAAGAASGEAWPMDRPEVPPEKRPSVSSAQALPRPLDLM
jgi:hypothetical protein